MVSRMRLAQIIAGQPIMPDPTEGKDTAVVVYRKGDTRMTVALDRFRLRTRRNPSPLAHLDVTELSNRWGHTITFVGQARG